MFMKLREKLCVCRMSSRMLLVATLLSAAVGSFKLLIQHGGYQKPVVLIFLPYCLGRILLYQPGLPPSPPPQLVSQ